MLELDRAAFATALGYASIGCWLCAQLPQVVKNIQLSSCDGLSFPFLVTWLFGDFTNLLGCILTDQLPFQTYLATYFCLVDITLVGQYFYYSSGVPATPLSAAKPHPSPRASLILPAPAQRTRDVPLSPRPQTRALTRPTSGRGRRRGPPPSSSSHVNVISESPVYAPPADSVDALYAAALDVARAAERISLRRSHSGRPRTRHGATMPGGSSDALVDSFHSELSLPSAISTEDEDESRHRMTQSTSALNRRGRSIARFDHATNTPPPAETEDIVDDLPDTQHMLEFRRHPSRSHSRSQSAARQRGSGRRAATVAFMSLGMLFWRASNTVPRSPGAGHVVAPPMSSVSSQSAVSIANSTWPYPVHPAHFPFRSSYVLVDAPDGTDPGLPKQPQEREQVSWQEAIGRVSAWCCTTLYLSSRLPQIWKNFQRKSVEGLSILLFLFAFLGNVLYVLSIVLAPVKEGETAHYLLRALPYLLGSGGTLLFDMTIMIQSWMYGSAPPIHVRTPLDRPRRAMSYGAIGRRRTRHAEDGTYGSISERRPLLYSPSRAATEPYPHPESRNSVSEAGSSGVAGLHAGGSEEHRSNGLGISLHGNQSPEKKGE